jgi:N utilization substance protein B
MLRPTQSSLARRIAVQILFAWDAARTDDRGNAEHIASTGEPVDPDVRTRAREIAEGAWGYREQSDAIVERIAPQWPVRRQPAVDRAILRIGVWELHHADTPPKVVIDEAIELAKLLSTEDSGAFVNGVLDAVFRERLSLASLTPAPEAADI